MHLCHCWMHLLNLFTCPHLLEATFTLSASSAHCTWRLSLIGSSKFETREHQIWNAQQIKDHWSGQCASCLIFYQRCLLIHVQFLCSNGFFKLFESLSVPFPVHSTTTFQKIKENDAFSIPWTELLYLDHKNTSMFHSLSSDQKETPTSKCLYSTVPGRITERITAIIPFYFLPFLFSLTDSKV